MPGFLSLEFSHLEMSIVPYQVREEVQRFLEVAKGGTLYLPTKMGANSMDWFLTRVNNSIVKVQGLALQPNHVP